MYFLFAAFQSTCDDTIKSILYSESLDTMNYAKKSRHIYYHAYFFIRKT